MEDLKTWLLSNIKWIIGMTAILLMNFFILKSQVDANTIALKNKLDKKEAQEYIDATISTVFEREFITLFITLSMKIKTNIRFDEGFEQEMECRESNPPMADKC